MIFLCNNRYEQMCNNTKLEIYLNFATWNKNVRLELLLFFFVSFFNVVVTKE